MEEMTLSPSSEMVYAGFWKRFAAMFIDGLIMMVPSLILGVFVGFQGFFPGSFSLLLGFLYTPFFDSSILMGTPGKAYMDLAVATETGERITFRDAMIRYLVRTFISGPLLGIGFFMNLFTAKRQTLHDILVSSVVIHRTMPTDVNFFGVWRDQTRKVFGWDEALGNASATSPSASITLQIEELHRLFQSGVITEADYLAKKDELLKRI